MDRLRGQAENNRTVDLNFGARPVSQNAPLSASVTQPMTATRLRRACSQDIIVDCAFLASAKTPGLFCDPQVELNLPVPAEKKRLGIDPRYLVSEVISNIFCTKDAAYNTKYWQYCTMYSVLRTD